MNGNKLYFDSNRYFKLFIDLTTKCNLICKYCFARKSKNWNNEMNMDDFNFLYKILKKFTKEKFYLIWFGGEPLLHSQIDIIISKIEKLQHQNIFLSNGLLDKNLYKKILEKNFVLSLTFHENLDKFLKNIDNLKEFSNQIVINILLEKPEYKELYNYAIKNKIKYLFTQIYDDNEQLINPLKYKEINNNIELFQDKKDYKKLIENHLKNKNRKKLCFFNEGNISINLNYTDHCRGINIDLKKNPFFFMKFNFKKPIFCEKICGDCYGKIICDKRSQ